MPAPLDADERRRELLDAAFALFAEHGYHALGMRALAEGLGVSTGALYHWFPGKELLFEAMLAGRVAAAVEAALGTLPEEVDARPAAVAAWVDAHADELRGLLRVALDYHRHCSSGRPALAALVAGLRTEAAARLGLPSARADALVVLLMGVLVTGVLAPDAPTLVELVAAV